MIFWIYFEVMNGFSEFKIVRLNRWKGVSSDNGSSDNGFSKRVRRNLYKVRNFYTKNDYENIYVEYFFNGFMCIFVCYATSESTYVCIILTIEYKLNIRQRNLFYFTFCWYSTVQWFMIVWYRCHLVGWRYYFQYFYSHYEFFKFRNAIKLYHNLTSFFL